MIMIVFLLCAHVVSAASKSGARAPLLRSGCPAEDRRDALLGVSYGSYAVLNDVPQGSIHKESQRFVVIQEVKNGFCKRRDRQTYEQDTQIASLAGVGLGPVGGFIFYSLIPQTWPAIGVGVASTAVLTGIFHGCARCMRYCEEQQEES